MPESIAKATPYDLMGGDAAVRHLVDRFYDCMDEIPEARKLREMHAKDLTPMRERLFEFMSGWLGGPAIYFQRPDAKCLGSAHRPFAIDNAMGDQWMLCMSRALADTHMDDKVREKIEQALRRVTEALRNC